MSFDYVPRSIAAFCTWIMNLLTYVWKHHERWGVPAPPERLAEQVPRLRKLAEKCATPDHTELDTSSKNELWKSVEKDIRNYLQGVVMHNTSVTDDDRRAMGLPVRDKVRTPIGDPVGQAEADITYPGRTQLLLRIRHVEGTPSDARANYGYRIYYGVFASGQPLPASGKELHESRFTRLRKELFDFDQADSSKTAVFCIRYENNKGKAGPWGPIFSAVIP